MSEVKKLRVCNDAARELASDIIQIAEHPDFAGELPTLLDWNMRVEQARKVLRIMGADNV